MVFRLLLTLSLFLLALKAQGGEPPRWVALSRLLTLDSENLPRATVISRLKSLADLDSKVRGGLQSQAFRPYALDVISALKLEGFIKELQLEIPKDPDGYGILTLNTLLDQKSYGPIASVYRSHIEDNLRTLSPGALVALVDSLARWGTPLKKGDVEGLLAHDYPEVRLATVDYIRSMILVYRK